MAAEEYNAFFYTLVSTVSPQANILYLHRGLILIRHLAFSLAGLRGFSYVSVLEGSKIPCRAIWNIFWPTGSLFSLHHQVVMCAESFGEHEKSVQQPLI